MNQLEVKRIVAELLPFIRYHRLEPGDRLPSERDLCKRFEASRGSVREALTALEFMRVVERRPNSGIYLQSLTKDTSVDAMVMFQDVGVPLLPQEMADFLETRRILEIESFKLACERRTDEDLVNLQGILDTCEELIEKGESIAEQDAIFHLALVEAGHNQVYLRLVNSFYLTSRKRRNQFFDSVEQSIRSHADHLKLFKALKQRDVDAATRVLAKHMATVEAFWKHRSQNNETLDAE
jgi:GntR family transcriptional repressor for pyruvate dehydrogenase complex